MKTILIILRHEFIGLISRKAFWFGIIGVPLLTGVIIAIVIATSGIATVAAVESREQTVGRPAFMPLPGFPPYAEQCAAVAAHAYEGFALA